LSVCEGRRKYARKVGKKSVGAQDSAVWVGVNEDGAPNLPAAAAAAVTTVAVSVIVTERQREDNARPPPQAEFENDVL